MYRGIVALVFVMAALLAAQSLTTPDVMASQKTGKDTRGQQLFTQYCASCHGTDGKGGGPVAASLKTAVPDLTVIEKREGKFPQARIQSIINGETTFAAHGPKEMPVWGFVLREKGTTQTAVTLNVSAMANYIKEIQQK